MDSEAFVAELVSMVDDFCRTLDASPPAYSYIPLSTDDERVLVMKSRLFNEQRAATCTARGCAPRPSST